MKNKITKRKIGRWTAFELFDSDNKIYCISCAKEGGAIVSDKNLKKAENKFIEGMKVAEAVKKLLYFKEHKKFPNS